MVFKIIISVILSILTLLFGKLDKSLIVFLLVLLIDFITGICKAIYQKNLSSVIGIKGIIKKFGYLIIISLATLIDKILGNTKMVRMMIIYFFVANEGLSILENWTLMGLPLPKKIYEVLKEIKDGENGSENKS